jgi:hypothetical protein
MSGKTLQIKIRPSSSYNSIGGVGKVKTGIVVRITNIPKKHSVSKAKRKAIDTIPNKRKESAMDNSTTNNSMSGYMQDSQGRFIPVELISDIDKLRDQTVRRIAEESLKMKKVLEQFKKQIREDIYAFAELSANQYGKNWGGKKGNITINTYDGKYRLVVSVEHGIVFNELIQLARQIIVSCLERWSTNARPEIKVLVNDAFRVDSAGKINVARILGLRRLEIDDPDWKKAMAAISDSMQVSGSKEYLRFYERNEQGKYVQIPLDLSVL